MSVSLDYAKRQLRYWRHVVRELRQTKRDEKRLTRKREKKGREKISPTPPLKREGVRKENATTATAPCARAKKHPTLEEVLVFAASRKIDTIFATAWYKQVSEIYRWRHPKSGKAIFSWKRYLQLWWERREEFDPLPVATESKQITINTKGLDAL